MRVFDWFRQICSGGALRSWEREVLSAVSRSVSVDARRIFDCQIKQITSIQRYAAGREVNLYRKPGSRPFSFSEEQPLFPLMNEALLGKIELMGSEVDERMKAEVWLVNGHVFSLVLNRPVEKRLFRNGVRIEKVQILCDPMVVLPEKRRNEILSPIDATLPQEYLTLVSDGKGIVINEWVIHEVSRIRKICQEDGDYYLLADRSDMGAIGVKEGDSSGLLYYLDYGYGDRGKAISLGMKHFVETFDGGKVAGRF